LCDSKDGRSYFRNFYVRRCLRIFPLYYSTLLLFLVIFPLLFPADANLRYVTSDPVWYWTYLSNVLVARAGFHPLGMLDHLWSLAIEEQFYLVWPIVVVLCTRERLQQLCVGLIAGGLFVRIGFQLWGYGDASYVLTPSRIDALAAGAVLAVVARGPDGLFRVASAARWTVGFTALVLALVWVWRGGLESHDIIVATIGHTLLACLFGAVIVVAMTSPASGRMQRWLTAPALMFLGQYSYAVYVFHYPLLFVRPSWLSPSAVPTIAGSHLPGLLLYIAGAALVSLALALTSWHLCEKQFLKLKRFFPYDSRHDAIRPVSTLGVPVAAHAYHVSGIAGVGVIDGDQ
jgi:peptidoglycan/LPS O-acetylase OafA/YrhL